MRIRSFSCLHEKEAPDPFVGMINLKARSDRDLGDVHARRSVGRIIRLKARKRGVRSMSSGSEFGGRSFSLFSAIFRRRIS
jgi:hypothetical protein